MPLSDMTIGSENFRVDLRSDRQGLIVALAGEFDLAGVAQFEHALAAVADAEPARVVVDFTELQFIDSTGIAAIVGAMAERERAGDRLCACGVRGQVQRLLELVGVSDRLSLVACPEGATPWPLSD